MENITIFADIIRVNISFVVLGTSPKEYYSMDIASLTKQFSLDNQRIGGKS